MAGKLTEGFRELMELRWSEFIVREANDDGTNFDTIITALVRAASKGNMRAIQTALDRLDGKIAMEIDVEYPKFYTIYPNARIAADDDSIIDESVLSLPSPPPIDTYKLRQLVGDSTVEDELPTGSLRAVLDRMLHAKKKIPLVILQSAEYIEQQQPAEMDPLVKSVIVAGLMKLVHDGKMSAVFEVLEQIDGKVADKLKVLGNDVYMKRFDEIAPAGAVKNEQGIYQIEADNVTNSWVLRLEKEQNKRGR